MRGINKIKGFLWKLFRVKNIKRIICHNRYLTMVYIFLLILVMCFGILLDSAYWGQCLLLADIVNYLKALKILGISYMEALGILRSNVGVLMTMVSIFLTMGINVAERSEKKVYGVYRKELFSATGQGKWLKWICYAAPILIIICLNLSYCVCGYLLIFYCYLFLIIRYHRHEDSYNRIHIMDAMVRKMLKYLPKEKNWNRTVLSNYQMLLENIGKSVLEEGNWQEIRKLYYSLLSKINNYDKVKKYKIVFYFEKVVYWMGNERGRMEAIEHLRAEIERIARETSCCREMITEHRPVLWGTLKVVIEETREEELINFFQWFLDIPTWSSQAMWQLEKPCPLEIIKEEAGLILLFLEYKFRYSGWEKIQLQLQQQVKAIWDYAEDSFLNRANEQYIDIYNFYRSLLEESEEDLEDCLNNLDSDFINGTKRSLISNILFWGEE